MKIAALLLSTFLFGIIAPGFAQRLELVRGTGQVVTEQFVTTSPMLVRAIDAAGRPAANVPITWSISQGSGTLVGPMQLTDVDGLASSNFLGTSIPPGTSFQPATVTATSAAGAVNFLVTTSAGRLAAGGTAAPPNVQLIAPVDDITGTSGSVIPGAVVIKVIAQSGIQVGQGVPNVGIRITRPGDPTGTPPAACNAPAGIVLTDATGTATCDLVLGSETGTFGLVANVGEYQNTRGFAVTVSPGAACTYTLSPMSQTIPSSGGSGTISINSASGCSWSAVSTAPWITLTTETSGTGMGNINYTVQTNTGAARTGTVTIAGQTITFTQSAAGGTGSGSVTFTTNATLPQATTGLSYSIALGVTGGTTPYTWSTTSTLPPGLSLNTGTGVLSGVASTAGSYSFTVTARDVNGASATRAFTLQVTSSPGSGSFVITTSSFPNGVVGVPYEQSLTAAGGCQNPFSGSPTFALASGTLPAGLALQALASGGIGLTGTPTTAGTNTFAIRATDPCGASTTRDFSIAVNTSATSATMTVTPGSVTFTVQQGGSQAAEQTLNITSSGAPLGFAVVASSAEGWFTAESSAATTPATIRVRFLPSARVIAPGTYNGNITITSQASNSPLNIPVTLNVLNAATVSVLPGALEFRHTTAVGGAVSQQQVTVSSVPPGVAFNASATALEGGTWLSVSPNSSQTNGAIAVIVNSTGLAPGTYTGTVGFTPVGNPSGVRTIPVTLTVTAAAAITAAPANLSFIAQSGKAAAAQSVSLTSTAAAASFTATPQTTSGGAWLRVSPTTGTTPASLSITSDAAALPPGNYTGSVTVQPDGGSTAFVIQVALQVTDGIPVINAVTNAGSFLRGPVAPGELVVIFGLNMGPDELVSFAPTQSGIATTLSQTRVFFDNIAAPLIYTSSGQLSAIVPYAIFGRTSVRIIVEHRGVSSAPSEVAVVNSVPSLFTLGGTQGAILNQDSSVNGPQNRAEAGSIIVLYGTGAGQMNPAGVTGAIASADILANPVLPVAVSVDGKQAEILYAGSAPGLPEGVIQVNARIPEDVRRNADVPVLLKVGEAISQPEVNVSVR